VVLGTPKRDTEDFVRQYSALQDTPHSPREIVKKVKVVSSMNIYTKSKVDWEISNTFRPIGAEEREERDSISLAGRRCPVFKSIVRGNHQGSSIIVPSQQHKTSVVETSSASCFRPVRPIAIRMHQQNEMKNTTSSTTTIDSKHIRTIDEIEKMSIRCVSSSPTRMLGGAGRGVNKKKPKIRSGSSDSFKEFRSSSW